MSVPWLRTVVDWFRTGFWIVGDFRLGIVKTSALALVLVSGGLGQAACTPAASQEQMMQDIAADAVEDAVSPLESRIETLEDQVNDLDGTVSDLEARIQYLEEEIN